MSREQPVIAIVDDEEPVRIALRRLLRSARLGVETFSSGAEFLDSLKSHQPDCLILDLHMPRINGFAVQTGITDAKLSLPVIVITGHDSPESRERAVAGGVAAYLLKPVDDQTLLDAVQQAMGGGKPS